MARSAGHFSMSATGNEVIGVDLGPDLNGSTISGTPTVTGTNCTAAYVSHTAAGVVSCRVSAGDYAGEVTVSAVLADGRDAVCKAEVRFL